MLQLHEDGFIQPLDSYGSLLETGNFQIIPPEKQ